MRFSLTLLFLAILVMGCGGNKTPQDVLGDANKAFNTEKDYAKAITLYRQVLNWKGEGAVTDQNRFEAAFNVTRCQVRQKEFDKAVASLDELQKAFKGTVTYKNYCTVITDLMSENASSDAIDVLGKAKDLYPKYAKQFESLAEKIKKLDLTDEDMKKLQSLGYL
jgi:tetratricopeptide (TPR) repeat protein